MLGLACIKVDRGIVLTENVAYIVNVKSGLSADSGVIIRFSCPNLKAYMACIAELYLLDAEGKRIPREAWTVTFADSEEITYGNRAADKSFDLQESTYWSTAYGVPFPHSIVIDLGGQYEISGLQYLPRMESSVPGALKDFRIHTR